MLAPPVTKKDLGPFRLDLVELAWSRIAPMVDALFLVGVVARSSAELRTMIGLIRDRGGAAIEHESSTRAIRTLAALEGMHARDWLERAAVAATVPRRKPPPAADLLLRFVGVECSRLLIEEDLERGTARCTIITHAGDVVSHEGGAAANAIQGAIKLAGARKEA